jgi:RND family efflux transporter MFP subunit
MRTRKPNPTAVLPLPLAGLLALAGCSTGSRADVAPTPRGLPVRTAAVEARDIDETLSLAGTLRPRAQVELVAEVQARLLRVLKDEGARVAQGEPLALLDPTDYRLNNDRARAALAVAEANRSHALAEKERADNLLKTGGITAKDSLSAQVALQVAEASLAQVKAESAIAAQQLARTEIRAPFAGRIARRHADPGAMLATGSRVFTLVDDGVLEFRAPVPSVQFGKAKLGAPVEVRVDALGGRSVAGRLARIAPIVDERTRSFEVTVEVPGQAELVGGLFARAIVRVGRVAGALVVPPQALQRDTAEADVAQAFVVKDGRAERRSVTLGVETPDRVQVKQGLVAGEKVVLDPPVALASGAPVELAPARAE